VAALSVAVFTFLIAVEVALMAAAVGRGPNTMTAPPVEQFALHTTLWGSNPAAALPLVMQQPVFVIAHNDPAGSVPTWGLHFFPLTLLVHLAIATVTAWHWHRSAGRRRQPGLLVAGGAALAFAVTYTRLASCCTGGPGWVLEIWLLALAFDPTSTLLDWAAIILRLGAFYSYLQFAIGLAGIALLIAATWRPQQERQPGLKKRVF
jgi:hypothetical protein